MIPALPELPRGLKGYVQAITPIGRVWEEAPPPESEREWQARFYQGDLGLRWKSTDGQEIELLDAGFWNHEPGPDFTSATIRINGTQTLRGDIELDSHALDWERHGHATNPAFAKVILHVFFRTPGRAFFTRTSEHRNVRQIALLHSKADPGAKSAPPGSVSRPAALQLLDLAARFRFHEKSRRLHQAASLHGWPAALDQALARCLGYQRNSLPFLLLAQRSSWQEYSGIAAEARLFGIAGFLTAERFESAAPTARAYLRRLWDEWWSRRETAGRLLLPGDAWNLAGIRPANHPHRRIGALVAARESLSKWVRAFEKTDRTTLVRSLSDLTHPYWQCHWNLHGTPFPDGQVRALIGAERLNDFLINSFHPWSLSLSPNRWPEFQRERANVIPPKVSRLAHWLSPELTVTDLRAAWIQQGLLQLAIDTHGRQSPQELFAQVSR